MLRSTIESLPQGFAERYHEQTPSVQKRARQGQKEVRQAQKQVRQAKKQVGDLEQGGDLENQGGDLRRWQDNLNQAEDNKPRRVLTAHGIAYIAKLVDKLMGCKAVEHGGSRIGSHCQLPFDQCPCSPAGKQLKVQFADVSPKVLRSLSKGDWLVRGLLFVQGLWMILQFIARLYERLSVTLLELYTVNHIALAITRFAVWWPKPIEVVLMAPLSLTKTQFKTMQDTHTEESTSHYRFYNVLSDPDSSEVEPTQTGIRAWWRGLLDMKDIDTCNANYFTSQATLGKSSYQHGTGRQSVREPIKAIARTMVILALSGHNWIGTGLAWGAICLGHNAIYVAAWNWYFPTPFERVAWRVCTLFIFVGFGCFILGMLNGVIYYWMATRFEICNRVLRPICRVIVRIGSIMAVLCVVPGVVAKLFCLVECLISLRKLPADTYVIVSWTSLLPHL